LAGKLEDMPIFEAAVAAVAAMECRRDARWVQQDRCAVDGVAFAFVDASGAPLAASTAARYESRGRHLDGIQGEGSLLSPRHHRGRRMA